MGASTGAIGFRMQHTENAGPARGSTQFPPKAVTTMRTRRAARQRPGTRIARRLARSSALLLRRRRAAVLLTIISLAVAGVVGAGQSSAALADSPDGLRAAQALTITTAKPFGPVPGTFEATGAFTESGTFTNTSFVFAALGAPGLVSIHTVQVFEGTQGSITIRADIKETLTQDALVLVDSGTWAIIDGTGTYETLRGRGTVTGTADEHSGVISRTYMGTVRFG